jgi:hypothetical protein
MKTLLDLRPPQSRILAAASLAVLLAACGGGGGGGSSASAPAPAAAPAVAEVPQSAYLSIDAFIGYLRNLNPSETNQPLSTGKGTPPVSDSALPTQVN